MWNGGRGVGREGEGRRGNCGRESKREKREKDMGKYNGIPLVVNKTLHFCFNQK